MVLGLNTIQMVALGGTIALGLTGLLWWLNRDPDKGPRYPVVDVLGYHPTSNQLELRTLKNENGAVKWVHEEGEGLDEDEAVVVVLDPNLKIASPFSDHALYFADVENGYVWQPEIEDERIEAIPINGKKLHDHQQMQEAEHWSALQEPDWAALARYAPWFAAVVICLLLVLAYGMFAGQTGGAA